MNSEASSYWLGAPRLTAGFCFTVLMVFAAGPARGQTAPVTVEVDVAAPAHPFPHFWEKMFGSGRAVLSLRESYRNDLRETRRITDFEYIRFHAIFHDELGVYDEDKDGKVQ